MPDGVSERSEASIQATALERGRSKASERGGRPMKSTAPTAPALAQGDGSDEGRADATRATGVGPSSLYRRSAHEQAGDPRLIGLIGSTDLG